MTNELSVKDAIEVFKFMKRDVLEESKDDKVLDMAIKALEQQPITWIVGKDNCQVAVRNMPIDKMQKICAIIGEEEQQPCDKSSMMYEIYMEGVNMTGEYQGCWVRFKNIEKIVNKYMGESEEEE